MVGVSVVVPAYNVEKYIERCIESVLKQTFTDWELLLVDDGSNDGTADICKKYVKADERILYLCQDSQGQGVARNNGVEKASGKYIFFLDSDDWIREDTLQRLYNYAEVNQLDLVFFDHITVERNAKGDMEERYFKLPIQIQKITNCLETPELLCRLEGAVWDKFYKKVLLNDIRQKGHPYEDSAILPVILAKSERIGQLKEAFYYYWSIREDSTVNKSDTVFCIKNVIQEVYDSFCFTENWEKYEDSLRKYTEWLILVAKNHIARQNASSEKQVLYDKFIEECWDFADTLYHNEKKMRSYQFLVWGSYNLRSIVNRTQRNLRVPKYYYGFSNITSLMQQRSGNLVLREVHPNGYRERMIQMDVGQTFRYLSDEAYKEIDFVCIDLLEERFLPVSNNGELITGSDALEEVTYKLETDVSYLGSEEWKKYALKYIAFLKEHFKPEQIVLVENYMCIAHGVYGAEELFGEEYGDIAGLNERLKECYQYFEEQYMGIHIVSNTKKELEYTDNVYPHGCVPWHQNEYLYYEMAEKIEQIILDYTENR